MARPTKKELERREAAKKRVEELLGDVIIDDRQVVEVADKLDDLKNNSSDVKSDVNSNKNTVWLEKEMNRLSEENKKLEDQLIIAKEDYNKLLNSGTVSTEVVGDSHLQAKVKLIFDELRNNYEVKKYTDVKIRHLLELFLQKFEFLRKK